MKICKKCLKEFESSNNPEKYCSQECRSKTCKTCLKPFDVVYRLTKYCSKECRFGIKTHCKDCKEPLTDNNKHFYKKLTFGCYPVCKKCKFDQGLKSRTKRGVYKERYCKNCNKKIEKLAAGISCSIECEINFFSEELQNGCIKWNGQKTIKKGRKDTQGRPVITKDGKTTGVRQILINKHKLYELEKKFVTTSCKFPLCVNYKHFVLAKNFINKESKTREGLIEKVREKYEKFGWSQNEIMKQFKMSPHTVSNIIKNKTYSGIQLKNNSEYDICINCSKQHDNLGSQYCSTQCAIEYLNK